MKIVFLGAPGSGKGTHAQKLSKQFEMPHISTGDIFRNNIKEETPLGLKVKEVLSKGLLVSDELTIDIVKDRLNQADCKNGFLLDGFPRSIAQAEALSTFQDIDFALFLEVKQEVLVERMSGRRFCNNCNAVYHVSQHKDPNCKLCQTKLSVRDDDLPETVAKRYKIFCDTTFPLVEYYEQHGMLKKIDGCGTINEVFDRILKAIGK